MLSSRRRPSSEAPPRTVALLPEAREEFVGPAVQLCLGSAAVLGVVTLLAGPVAAFFRRPLVLMKVLQGFHVEEVFLTGNGLPQELRQRHRAVLRNLDVARARTAEAPAEALSQISDALDEAARLCDFDPLCVACHRGKTNRTTRRTIHKMCGARATNQNPTTTSYLAGDDAHWQHNVALAMQVGGGRQRNLPGRLTVKHHTLTQSII